MSHGRSSEGLDHGQMGRRRHDADDGVGIAVERDCFADDGRIARELGAPQIVHEYDDALAAGLRIVAGKGAADLRLYGEHGKDAGRGRDGFNLHRVIADAERERAGPHGGHGLDGAGVALPHFKVIGVEGQGWIEIAELGHLLLKNDEAVRVGIGKRAEEHVVDEGEDGGGGADAEGQRQDDGEGEAGCIAQLANGIAQILEQSLHDQSPK